MLELNLEFTEKNIMKSTNIMESTNIMKSTNHVEMRARTYVSRENKLTFYIIKLEKTSMATIFELHIFELFYIITKNT